MSCVYCGYANVCLVIYVSIVIFVSILSILD